MRFLYPFGLLGLITIPVIIGLHLHLERNRRVLVSSMFLWQFLDAKFQGQKPRFVRFTWLLLLDVSLAA
ncbi:MAG: BatA domain-containing protein, partial [Anaerolineales bacterium]